MGEEGRRQTRYYVLGIGVQTESEKTANNVVVQSIFDFEKIKDWKFIQIEYRL